MIDSDLGTDGALANALIFPGQGASSKDMLEPHIGDSAFKQHYPLVCDLLGVDVREELQRSDGRFAEQNEVSSTLALLVGGLWLERLRDRGVSFDFVAGYSAGQWTALVAAEMLPLATALRIGLERTRLLNLSPAGREGAMLAVIGLRDAAVEEVCQETLDWPEGPVAIGNYNFPGQVTVSASVAAIERVTEVLRPLRPRKLTRLPVSGAWHCGLARPADTEFRKYLETVHFESAKVPVADNVTGALMPSRQDEIRDTLAQGLTAPVQWTLCVRTLASLGAQRFIEVGYGSTLSKFGFMIDRKRSFLTVTDHLSQHAARAS